MRYAARRRPQAQPQHAPLPSTLRHHTAPSPAGILAGPPPRSDKMLSSRASSSAVPRCPTAAAAALRAAVRAGGGGRGAARGRGAGQAAAARAPTGRRCAQYARAFACSSCKHGMHAAARSPPAAFANIACMRSRALASRSGAFFLLGPPSAGRVGVAAVWRLAGAGQAPPAIGGAGQRPKRARTRHQRRCKCCQSPRPSPHPWRPQAARKFPRVRCLLGRAQPHPCRRWRPCACGRRRRPPPPRRRPRRR